MGNSGFFLKLQKNHINSRLGTNLTLAISFNKTIDGFVREYFSSTSKICTPTIITDHQCSSSTSLAMTVQPKCSESTTDTTCSSNAAYFNSTKSQHPKYRETD